MLTKRFGCFCLALALAWSCLRIPPDVHAASAMPSLTAQAVARPSASIPIGAQRVVMLTLRLTASCSRDIGLSSLVLQHTGLGDPQDLERVYASMRGMRRSRISTINGRDGIVTLRLRSVKIRACTTESVDVLADFRSDATATGQHALSLASSSPITADPAVLITVNPAGNPAVLMPVGAAVGTISSEPLSLLTPLNYGSARTVARLRLRGDSRDDLVLTAITFTNDGTARNDDLQNLFLETSGHTRLSATQPMLDGDHVRVVLDPPMTIHRNEVRLVQLLADIRASRRHTVDLRIEEPGDMETMSTR